VSCAELVADGHCARSLSEGSEGTPGGYFGSDSKPAPISVPSA
jgi:hypothetical protein